APDGLNSPRYRRTFVQREMCPCAVVIVNVRKEHMAQVPLAKDDDMVKTFPPDRYHSTPTRTITPCVGSIRVLMRIVVLLYFQIPSVPTFHNRATIPSGAGSLRAWLRQHPFAAATLDRAALFHRLKRMGKRPAAHFPPRRPQLFGEFGERKRAGPV